MLESGMVHGPHGPHEPHVLSWPQVVQRSLVPLKARLFWRLEEGVVGAVAVAVAGRHKGVQRGRRLRGQPHLLVQDR